MPSKYPRGLKQFNGDPRELPLFLANFKFLVHDAVQDDGIRLARSREALATHVARRFANLLYVSSNYLAALQALKNKCGQPFMISAAHIDTLRKLPVVKNDDSRTLYLFVEKLNAAVAALETSEYAHELRSTTLLQELLEKLPLRLRREWGDVVVSCQPRPPTLQDFDSWLEKVSTREMYANPTSISFYGREERRTSSQPTKSHSTFATTNENVSCPTCAGTHEIATCEKFKSMTGEEKVQVVRQAKLCYRCLSIGHRAAKCRKSATCTVEGCNSSHRSCMVHDVSFPKDTQQPARIQLVKLRARFYSTSCR